jgi:hypothetical protein
LPEGVDDPALRSSIAHSLADLIEAVAERVLFISLGEGPWPELLAQLVLGDRAPMPLDEVHQHLQGLRFERDVLPTAAQRMAFSI